MSTPTLDPDLLRSFVLIADEGGIARAAAQVGRSQSAVSMQMQRLEDLVGRPLLRRDGRGTALTTAGEVLLGHARRLLRAQDEAWRDLVHPPLTGRVRLGSPDDFAIALLPGPMARFAAEHPAVDLQIVCEPTRRLLPQIESGTLDLAVVSREDGWRGSILRHEPIIWAAAEGFDLSRRPLPVALYQPGCICRDRALKALTETGIEFREAYASDSMVGLLTAVRAGLAVAALPACAAPPDVRRIGSGEGLPSLGGQNIGLEVSANPAPPVLAMAAMLRALVC